MCGESSCTDLVPPADSRSPISDFFIPWRGVPRDEPIDPHQPPVGNFFLAIFTGARSDRSPARRRRGTRRSNPLPAR